MAKRGRYKAAEMERPLPFAAARLTTIAQGLGLKSSYQQIKKLALDDATSCAAVAQALVFLGEILDDEAFRTAAMAMGGYGLREGGLRQSVSRLFREEGRTEEWSVMDQMHRLVTEGSSQREAAAFCAAIYGIEGHSHKSIVDRIRKTYRLYLEIINGEKPKSDAPPKGDTLRRLKVQLVQAVILGPGCIRRLSTFPPDAIPIPDGFYIVPDNREWRRLVHRGHAVLYGVIDDDPFFG